MWDAISQDLPGALHEPQLAAVLMRLMMAALLGAVVGIDREMWSHISAIRTFGLVSLGSCLFALVTYGLLEHAGRQFQGPSGHTLRLISTLILGIAFLGALSIQLAGGRAEGLFTAVTTWMAGAIGLACGIGQVGLAIIATILLSLGLYLCGKLDRRTDELVQAKPSEIPPDTHPPKA